MTIHDTKGGCANLAMLTSMTSSDGTATYCYDPTGQLIGATYTGSLPDESYTYDANGCVYATGADNELLFDGTYTFSCDGEGNRVARFIDADQNGQLDAGDTDVTTYECDQQRGRKSFTLCSGFVQFLLRGHSTSYGNMGYCVARCSKRYCLFH